MKQATASAKRYFGFGRFRAADYPLTDGDVDKLARRIAVPVTQAFRTDVQRAISVFVDSTMCGIGLRGGEQLLDPLYRVLRTFGEGPHEALRLIIAAVERPQDDLSDAETVMVFAFLASVGIGIKRLTQETDTITVKDLYAMTERARVELHDHPWRRGRGNPDDLLLQMFVEHLVRAAEHAGYDVAKTPKWRPKAGKRPPPLVRFVEDALYLALCCAQKVLADHRQSWASERCEAISKRLAELDDLSARALADRVAAGRAQKVSSSAKRP
jgi:hypothetical protein